MNIPGIWKIKYTYFTVTGCYSNRLEINRLSSLRDKGTVLKKRERFLPKAIVSFQWWNSLLNFTYSA